MNNYFSIFGGTVYEVSDEDVNILDAFQIPLKRKPFASCKKCHGTFYTGFDSIKRIFIICPSCARKCIDIDKVLLKKSEASKKNKNGIA